MGRLKAFWGQAVSSKWSKTGSKQPEQLSLSTPSGLGSFGGETPWQPFADPCWGCVGLFCGWFWGQTTPFTGGKQAKYDQKAAHTLPKWIISLDTATRTLWCMSRGHQAPFGAILGAVLGVDRVKTGKTPLKGSPHIARVGSVPRHGHRTPVPVLEPSGPDLGRLGAKLAKERTPRAQNGPNGAQQDP